ncbi:MAG: YdeI/OmpD-associated family protein, partial [Chitinophagales bacterium]
FKQHAVFGFWKAALMKDKSLMENAASEASMGHLGKITTLKDLPSDKKITAWIKEAMKLTDEGKKVEKKKPSKEAFVVLEILSKAINKNKKAKAVWDKASYSFQKEYALWVEGAKSQETKASRTETAVEWIAEGKGRNWKYER